MTKNSIAVTMRYDYFYNGKEVRNGIDFNLINWVYNLGYTPHLVPNDIRYFKIIKKNKFAGFILSGGNDINIKTTRVLLENKILKLSIKDKTPVLGICHGMQIMNRFEDGNLKRVSNHVQKHHKLCDNEFEYPNKVNSFHKFGIKRLGKNFEVIAYSNDNQIEAIKHKKYNWLGWMWHPERDKAFNKKLLKIAKDFFKK